MSPTPPQSINPTTRTPPPTLLTLPYDIRHTIYTHLFHPGPQLYLHALPRYKPSHKPLQLMPLEDGSSMPISLLLAGSRALHREASEFLYNGYVFSIVGTKRDCLGAYAALKGTMEKYARHGDGGGDAAAAAGTGGRVRVDAFSNGDHSATSCIYLQLGEGKMWVLAGRQRGVRKTLAELEREVAMLEPKGQLQGVDDGDWRRRVLRALRDWLVKERSGSETMFFVLAVVVVIVSASLFAQ